MADQFEADFLQDLDFSSPTTHISRVLINPFEFYEKYLISPEGVVIPTDYEALEEFVSEDAQVDDSAFDRARNFAELRLVTKASQIINQIRINKLLKKSRETDLAISTSTAAVDAPLPPQPSRKRKRTDDPIFEPFQQKRFLWDKIEALHCVLQCPLAGKTHYLHGGRGGSIPTFSFKPSSLSDTCLAFIKPICRSLWSTEEMRRLTGAANSTQQKYTPLCESSISALTTVMITGFDAKLTVKQETSLRLHLRLALSSFFDNERKKFIESEKRSSLSRFLQSESHSRLSQHTSSQQTSFLYVSDPYKNITTTKDCGSVQVEQITSSSDSAATNSASN